MDSSLIQTIVVYALPVIFAITLHEAAHGYVARMLGDNTAYVLGRVSFNPMRHIDPIGTILMPLIGALAPGGFPLLAWGKPVQTNPRAYRGISPRNGNMLVSLMGPFMNLVLALAISILLVVVAHVVKLPTSLAVGAIRYFLVLNISLMFFNLLPVPPLDGGSVLAALLPDSLQTIPRVLQRYGMLILFALLLTGAMSVIMYPAYQLAGAWARVVMRLMYG